jgi:hypothetical protein
MCVLNILKMRVQSSSLDFAASICAGRAVRAAAGNLWGCPTGRNHHPLQVTLEILLRTKVQRASRGRASQQDSQPAM